MNNMFSKSAIWVVVALLLFMLFKQFETCKGNANHRFPIQRFERLFVKPTAVRLKRLSTAVAKLDDNN